MHYNITYIEKWINTDSFAKKLLKKSHFTKKQLKDYVTYVWNKDNGTNVTYEQIAKIRNVTKQGVGENIKLARENIDKSMATLLLSVYTNIIPVETIDFFIEILDALRVAKESEDEFEFRLLRKKMMKILSEGSNKSLLSKEEEV